MNIKKRQLPRLSHFKFLPELELTDVT